MAFVFWHLKIHFFEMKNSVVCCVQGLSAMNKPQQRLKQFSVEAFTRLVHMYTENACCGSTFSYIYLMRFQLLSLSPARMCHTMICLSLDLQFA